MNLRTTALFLTPIALLALLLTASNYPAPSSGPVSQDANPAESQLDVDVDLVMGGLGGMMTITDAANQKAYLYQIPTDLPESENSDHSVNQTARLIMTIDLKSAGEPEIPLELFPIKERNNDR